MGTRNKLFQTEGTRAKIQASQIINRLENHILGELDLSATQVNAAKILLSKTVPDLSSVQLTGDPEKPVHIVTETDKDILERYTKGQK